MLCVERATSIIYAVIKLPHRRPMDGIRVLYKSNSRPAILWQLDEVYRTANACRNYMQMQARATILEHDIQELVHKYKLLDERYITRPVRAWLLCIPPTFQHWHGCAASILVKDVELTMQKVDKEIAALKRRAKREADKIVKNHPLAPFIQEA